MEHMVPVATQRWLQVVFSRWHGQTVATVGASVLLLAACSTTDLDGATRAPVVDKSSVKASVGESAPTLSPNAFVLGQENAGKPGYYTVRKGDTLTRIGLETGQSPRDLAKWNGLNNPNLIEEGQVLRVVAPVGPTPVPSAAPPASVSGGVVAAPINGVESRAQGRPLSAPATPLPAPAAATGEEVAFSWPVNGVILERFDEARNKGLDLSGKAGDAVLAAADGRVVYAGSGLRGYGNLIILKHNNTYLTAYAHNQALLVKEDQTVRQGQKIAEMGSSDADKVKLHFEVRRSGKPVDPLKYLPAR